MNDCLVFRKNNHFLSDFVDAIVAGSRIRKSQIFSNDNDIQP